MDSIETPIKILHFGMTTTYRQYIQNKIGAIADLFTLCEEQSFYFWDFWDMSNKRKKHIIRQRNTNAVKTLCTETAIL